QGPIAPPAPATEHRTKFQIGASMRAPYRLRKGMCDMNFLRRNWYYIGGVIFVALAVVLVVYWNDMSVLRRLMIMSFMALTFHQFEEYAWPGGFHAIYNIVFRPMGSRPERYHSNPQNVLITNVFVAYTHYVLPILFPNIIWL